MASKYRKKAFPAIIYTALILCVLMLIGRTIKTTIIDRMNPDTRDVTEMCFDVWHYHCRKDCKQSGRPDDTKCAHWAKEMEAQMQLHQFWESEAPEKPEDPNKIKGWELDYELWEENNKTRGEYVFVHGIVPLMQTKEESEKGAAKFLYFDNLHHYLEQGSHRATANGFWQLIGNKYWLGQVEWIKDGYADYMKELPPEEKKGPKEAWPERTFKKYLTEVYLGEQLDCPRWADGSCIRTWEGTTKEDHQVFLEAIKNKDEAALKAVRSKGRECLLVKPLADAVTQANAWMHRALEGQFLREIYPYVCYRNNLQQAMLWAWLPGKGHRLPSRGGKDSFLSRLTKKRVAVTPPGRSKHEQGLAMDVWNWQAAQPYLVAKAGMICKHVPDDDPHCSIAEIELSMKNTARKLACEAKAHGKSWVEMGKILGLDLSFLSKLTDIGC